MKNKKLSLVLSLLVLAAILSPFNGLSPSGVPLLSPLIVQAKADTSAPVAASTLNGVDDPAELEAFMDDLFTQQMTDYGIAGLTVSLVKDGQVFFQKGYGYADIENQTPVDPAATLFRTGSVTKLFTWTAVMQLVGTGQTGPGCRHQHLPGFQDPGHFRRPDHAQASAFAYCRF